MATVKPTPRLVRALEEINALVGLAIDETKLEELEMQLCRIGDWLSQAEEETDAQLDAEGLLS